MMLVAQANIERFDSIVGIVFAHLYQNFPIRQIIDPTILDPLVNPGTQGWEACYLEHVQVFIASMSWLIKAEYVWAEPGEEANPETFFGCVLSTKGLEVLNTPSSLGPSIGSKLKDAVQSTAGDTVKDLAKEALSAGAILALTLGRSFVSA